MSEIWFCYFCHFSDYMTPPTKKKTGEHLHFKAQIDSHYEDFLKDSLNYFHILIDGRKQVKNLE